MTAALIFKFGAVFTNAVSVMNANGKSAATPSAITSAIGRESRSS